MARENGKEKARLLAEDAVSKIKDLVKKGNVTRILVSRKGETVASFPLTAGVVGVAAAAPWALLLTVIATIGLDCTVDVVKEDGRIVHIV